MTRYGLPTMVILPLIILIIAAVTSWLWPAGRPESLFAGGVLTILILAFFRDPQRQIPSETQVLLAPADGKITDICQVEEANFIKGKALRIGIFLSIFDVHINRTPCAGRVVYLQAQPGKFFNALRYQAASQHNQSNCVGIECPEHPAGEVLVKQISGAIARRIVCDCRLGDNLAAGQRFGMIKFGSRTELFLPHQRCGKVVVKVGDKVRAGTTILVRYGTTNQENI